MRNRRTEGFPSDTENVEKFVGTAYDAMKSLADNLDALLSLSTALATGVGSFPAHDHSTHTGIGTDDHHSQVHTHASHTGIGVNDHHNRDHPFLSTEHVGIPVASPDNDLLSDAGTWVKIGAANLSPTLTATLTGKLPIDGSIAMAGNLDMGIFLVDGRDVSVDGTTQDSHIADGTKHFLQGAIDHVNILNKGTNTHAQIDTHLAHVTNPHGVTYAQLTGQPTIPAAQTFLHANLTDVLADQHHNKAHIHDGVDGSGTVGWSVITGKPATFPVAGHTHNSHTGIGANDHHAQIHATQHEIGGNDLVDHNVLTNYVADKHVAHTGIVLTAGNGLSGGGDISASRSFAVDLNELGTETSIVDADFIVMVDATDSGSGKITWANIKAALAGGALDHGALGGLTDDDHAQYLLADGTRALTGNWAVGGFDITGVGEFDATTSLLAATGNQTAFAFTYTVNKATSGFGNGLLINTMDTLSPSGNFPLGVQSGGVDILYVEVGGPHGAIGALHVDEIYSTTSAGSLYISGANNTTGAGIELFDNNHPSQAFDIEFTTGGVATALFNDDLNGGTWDYSVGGYHFVASDITATTGVFSGALSCAALTSTGIDDNATAIVLTLDPTTGNLTHAGNQMVVGNASNWNFIRDNATSVTTFGGDISQAVGPNFRMFGSGHGSRPDQFLFRTGNVIKLQYTNTGLWTFSANLEATGWIKSDVAIYLKERAAADSDVSLYGQLWVKNTATQELWFTDEAGTDTQIV